MSSDNLTLLRERNYLEKLAADINQLLALSSPGCQGENSKVKVMTDRTRNWNPHKTAKRMVFPIKNDNKMTPNGIAG